MAKLPPQRALKFLRWFCREDYLEEIEGDLIEIYEMQYEESEKKAGRKFFWNVLTHFHPAYIKAFNFPNLLIYPDMFKNYFKVSLRNLWRQKLYSFINIAGLSIGLCCFALIYLYVQREYSFDGFYKDSDQIYRVIQKWEGNEFLGTDFLATTSAGLASTMMAEYPEVQSATSFSESTSLLSVQQATYYEKGLEIDKHFFEVFPLTFVRGNQNFAFEQLNSVVLTESLSKKIFGNVNPLGKSIALDLDSEISYTVTGLVEDFPSNSSFDHTFFTSIEHSNDYLRDQNFSERWYSSSFHTFFRARKSAKMDLLQSKLQVMIDDLSSNFNPFPFEVGYFIQPLSELHLETKAAEDIGAKGNARYLSLFSLIAVLVLLLASINYINLAIARMLKRAKEVSVRKAIGAAKSQIVAQFMGESVLFAFIAFVIAIILAYFLAPQFGKLLDSPISINLREGIILLPGLLIAVLIVGFISGIYPAFVASSLNPGQITSSVKIKPFLGLSIQRILIIGQYAVSIALIISSIIFYRQFQYIQHKELGYNKDHIVSIPIPNPEMLGKLDLGVLKNEWSKYPDIKSVTASNSLPTNISSSSILNHDYSTGTSSEDGLAVYRVGVNYDFFDVFGIDFLAGRAFSPEIALDTISNYIINETAAKSLGWSSAEAIGKTFQDGDKAVTVIGVIKDFHMHSMHKSIEPLIVNLTPDYYEYISLRLSPTRSPQVIEVIKQVLEAQFPYSLEYSFLDSYFDQLYETEFRLGKMLSFFTSLAILIASMGLFGLAAFSIEQRRKEMSIRKVLGASVQSLVSLFSIEFLKLVLLGFFAAVPIAWYAMNLWLNDFSYRTKLDVWIFLFGGILAIVIAIFTVGAQSIKAAIANPSHNLKRE